MTISEAIISLIPRFGGDPEEINNGDCEEFAKSVCEIIEDAEPVWDIEEDKDQHIFKWCHCFVKYEGMYYDSECSHGTKYWWNLPCFVRIRSGYGCFHPGKEYFQQKEDEICH